MNQVSLSIVLPCYNPPKGWIEKVISTFQKVKSEVADVELILVNDGSTNSVEVDLEVFKSIPEISTISYQQNRGKGHALRTGIIRAKNDLVIYTDIDFPYTHESFLRIYSALMDDKADMAIGIRGKEYYAHLPKTRVRISKLLRWFIKTFLRLPTDDTQCGLKGFNQKGKEVFLQTTINRYLFDLEFVFIAARNKLSIKTVEVELRPEVSLSKMNWKVLFQESGNFLKIFFKSLFS